MVTFGTITDKTVRAAFSKTDIEGFVVNGNAAYNKENKLTDAYGTISKDDNSQVCNFNVYGAGDNMRVNLSDCPADLMTTAVEIAQAALADLAGTYPETI